MRATIATQSSATPTAPWWSSSRSGPSSTPRRSDRGVATLGPGVPGVRLPREGGPSAGEPTEPTEPTELGEPRRPWGRSAPPAGPARRRARRWGSVPGWDPRRVQGDAVRPVLMSGSAPKRRRGAKPVRPSPPSRPGCCRRRAGTAGSSRRRRRGSPRTYPVTAAPKREAGADALQRDRVGLPDRHPPGQLEPVGRTVDDDRVVRDRDVALLELSRPRCTVRTWPTDDVLDGAQQLQLHVPSVGAQAIVGVTEGRCAA